MTEIGEVTAVWVPKKQNQKGALRVKVVDRCGDKGIGPIAGAVVKVGRQKYTTGGSGIVEFRDLPPGFYTAYVNTRYKKCDYIKFLIHYFPPARRALTMSYKAKDDNSGGTVVENRETADLEVMMFVTRFVNGVTFKRKHIDFSGDDMFGHWWTEIDGAESYGWWPKFRIGSDRNRKPGSKPQARPPKPPAANAGWKAKLAFKFANAVYGARRAGVKYGQVLFGVEGELNGQSAFGGLPTVDPHHGDKGDDSYAPIIETCETDPEIKDALRRAKDKYVKDHDTWSWRFEFGNNCHSMQIYLMDECKLDKFQEVRA